MKKDEQCMHCKKLLIKSFENKTWSKTKTGIILCIKCESILNQLIKLQQEKETLDVYQ